jgi:hypothetical protein
VVCACCRLVVFAALLATACAALRAYPHQLAYFNELHGGLSGGHERLLHSSVDWDQDWLLCRDALFGPTKSIRHNYAFVYASDSSAALLAGCFRDPTDLRWAWNHDPPGTRFGLCIGRTMASLIVHGHPTELGVGTAHIAECLRRADGWTAVTPTILLVHCRTPG